MHMKDQVFGNFMYIYVFNQSVNMSSLVAQCKSVNDGLDLNKNFPFPMKGYSLRPRGTRIFEEPKSSDLEGPKPSRTKRKPRSMPLSKYRRKSANARERCRMREINEAFETLRRVIPQMASRECSGEKLTKISTLRLAMKYISTLSRLLQDQDLEFDGESFLGDYALSLTSSDSHDELPPLTPRGDAPMVCPEAPLSFVDPFLASSLVFDDGSYLLDDVPLFISEFS